MGSNPTLSAIPFAENHFSVSAIQKVRDRKNRGVQILVPEEQQAFFDACDDWQPPIFLMPAGYGLRGGELTHPLYFSTAAASSICVDWWATWCGTRVGRWLASQAGPRRCGAVGGAPGIEEAVAFGSSTAAGTSATVAA